MYIDSSKYIDTSLFYMYDFKRNTVCLALVHCLLEKKNVGLIAFK